MPVLLLLPATRTVFRTATVREWMVRVARNRFFTGAVLIVCGSKRCFYDVLVVVANSGNL